jgi:hypothetical protein
MVNLMIFFDTTMRIPLSDEHRSELDEQLHQCKLYVENLEGGYAGALKTIKDRILHKVLNKKRPYLPLHAVKVHIAPENTLCPYYSFSYRGDRSQDFQRISPSAWDRCAKASKDQTVVACVELVPQSDHI